MQSSNDYLSLTASTSLREAYLSRLAATPSILGSTGSRLLSGATSPHLELENRLAEHFDSPAALLFNSGWDANVSFFATVPQQPDWIIYDELVHASVHSGMRGSRVLPARRIPFRHNDSRALDAVLETISKDVRQSKGTVFIALESLYSMDGDFAPLPELLNVLDKHIPREHQCVVLDEAHSTGVYGDGGRGIAYALNEHQAGAGQSSLKGKERERSPRQGRVAVRLMTFGKAVGSSGGESVPHYELCVRD
jgi:8-amino-7-oxononanoate synthase